MGLIKVRGWALTIIRMIALPTLVKIHDVIARKAAETPAEWDDVLAGSFATVITFLQDPEAFEEDIK